MTGPLEGVRIVDLTTMISGPYATMLLGDQGADVIKVEQPGRGDQMRHYGRRRRELTAPFINNNRNKRSVALDLKSPDGSAVLKRLVETADVLVQNFRPGVVEKLGVDAATMREANPRLIYLSISGFGEKGPLAHKPAYDPIIQAATGLASIQGGGDTERPRMIRAMLPDKLAALMVAQAVAAALFARSRTGEGQHVRLSMLDVVLSFLWSGEMDGHTFVGQEVNGPEVMSPFDLIYETKDGHICVAVVTDRQWASFAGAVDHPEWLQDPRFATSEARERHRDERLNLTQQALRERRTDEWVEIIEAADVPCSPVLTRRDVVRHPHLRLRGSLLEYDHPSAGPLRQADHPVRFETTPAAVRRPPPLLGEHTREVLVEAGFDDVEIERLRAAGVIG